MGVGFSDRFFQFGNGSHLVRQTAVKADQIQQPDGVGVTHGTTVHGWTWDRRDLKTRQFAARDRWVR